jgi:hypothetical protein
VRRRLPLITFLLAAFAVSGIATAGAVVGPIGFSGADPIDFGSQEVGTNTSKTVTITNPGDEPMTIDGNGVQVNGTNQGSFLLSNDVCSGRVVAANGGTCTVDVTFHPNSAGTYNATLDVTDTADSVTGSTGLTGNGIVGPSVSVSPASPYGFGDRKVGTSDSQQFTLTNNGDANLSIPAAGVTVSGAGFSKTNDNCSGTGTTPNVVLPGGNCTFEVVFLPGSTGTLSGSASITSNDPSSPSAISLSGNGTVPVATPSPPTSFQTPVNTPQQKTITLTNTGQADLIVQPATLTGSTTFTKQTTGTPCGNSTLPPGGQCTVDITFLPTTTAAQNATLTFTDDSNSTADSVQSVALTGTVLIPGITSDPASLSFETLAVGAISPVSTVTVTNTGGADLRVSSLAVGGTNYKSFRLGLETCTSAPIAAGNSCTVNVRFTPRNLGTRVATVLVRSDAGASNSTLSVGVTGVGVRPPPVVRLHGAAGCIDTRLSWANPDATRLIRVQVVRNSAHAPRGPFDGVVLKHTTGALADDSVRRLHTYYYAVYAVYMAFDHSDHVYSAAASVRLHTGRICTPRNGSVIGDMSPTVDWTSYPHARSYAYILQRFGRTILVRYPKLSRTTLRRSWTFNGQSKSIQSGGVYSFYLYTYTAARPRGFLIGLTVFTER